MTSPVEIDSSGNHWRNWSGLVEATADRVVTPTSVDAVVDVVRQARDSGTTVKMTGTGHSFTAIAAPEHTLLLPGGMSGILSVDRDAMTVTARAGTPLHELNLALERLGLSLHNMGDIAEQTLAGATSTGTHGTGGIAAGLSAQLAGLELVTGTGEVVRASADGERRRLRRRPRRARRARHPDHPDVPGRAALRHRGARAADDVGPRPRLLRRDGRGARTTSTCTGSPTPTG